jgi:serine/threonine-protein kinase
MVKDIGKGEYYVEKSLVVNIDFQKRLFENEIRIHSSLKHRYIINFVEQLDDHRFLMEYAPGGNLQDILHPGVDEKLKLKYSNQFLQGLAYLHELGYAHNDIKPTNILITREERAKLADFAFCGKLGEVTFDEFPSTFMLGTDFFRRPGQEKSFVNQAANDIYSVGKVLYLLFSGSRDYRYVDVNVIGNKVVREVVEKCLDGAYSTVEPVLKALTGR